MNPATHCPPAATDNCRLLDFRPGMNMCWEITRSASDTNGELLETINWVGPNTGGPPVHVHDTAQESYEVLEGTLQVLIDGDWLTLHTGEKASVPPRTPHTLKNASDEPVRIINIHRPALNFEAMFRDMHALIQARKIKRLPPKDPRSMITAAMLFTRYRDEQRFTQPPQPVFSALAILGRAAGVKLES